MGKTARALLGLYAVLAAVAAGPSCGLNPQPEPPGVDRGAGGGQTGGWGGSTATAGAGGSSAPGGSAGTAGGGGYIVVADAAAPGVTDNEAGQDAGADADAANTDGSDSSVNAEASND
jgi:hypothetical protein